VNTNTVNNLFATGILASALAACGGGDAPLVCTAEMHPVTCLSPTGTASGPLFTTAPADVTLDAGAATTFTVSGGTPPYTATSGNTNVVTASISGNTLSVTSVSPGSTSVTVVDSLGSRLDIGLTVLAQGQGGQPLSLTPAALTIGNCTTRVPFIFRGGIAPFTVFTSNNFNVPVSSALPLADGRSYFFADVRYPPIIPPPDERTFVATLTVLDSQSRSAVVTVTTPVRATDICPANLLLQVLPESANFRRTEILTFQVSGGPSPAAVPKVTFADAGIAEVVSVSATTVNVRAVGVGATLMTIESGDGQRASVVINVLPQP
jgi:hypothetical protein